LSLLLSFPTRRSSDLSFYLLEQFVPGAVYHVDSVVWERGIAFAEAHAYGTPPLDTSHHGGVFTTRTLPREAEETKSLLEINRHLDRKSTRLNSSHLGI